jgi:phage terminase large subunit
MENLIQFECNDAYIPYLTEKARIQIFFGGASSGKSVFLAQRTVFDLMLGGRNYLVCRQVGRTIRKSVFNEIAKAITDLGVNALFVINRTDGVITHMNGYQILFAGLDDPEKIKSITPAKGVITDIWVEEATETERNTIKQLLKRQRGGDEKYPKRLVLSFNPILQQHWIFEEYFSKVGWEDKQTAYKAQDGSLSILKTWYIHNRFLTPDDVRDLENETDPYYYKVYSLGEWGILGNVIFTNWRVEDLSVMRDQFTNRRNGLDFGYSSDPAALAVMHYDRMRKTLYIFDELYETKLTNDLLAQEVKKRIGGDLVTCDSAEPKSIAELQRYGVNARGAKKGKDSVVFGIQWLRQQSIVIDKTCINMQREAQSYKWKEDAAGNPLPIPVDKFNHLWDGVRYGTEDDSLENFASVVDDPLSGW